MSRIILYIASSIDGYIADLNGSVEWLEKIPNPQGSDYGYGDFINEIDTVVMGRTTYEQVLGFGDEWPYKDQHTVVVTSDRSYEPSTPNTTVLSTLHRSVIEKLRNQSHKSIWLVGGGQMVNAFLKLGAIDHMKIFIMPTILGQGVRLFPATSLQSTFDLQDVNSFSSGVVALDYTKK